MWQGADCTPHLAWLHQIKTSVPHQWGGQPCYFGIPYPVKVLYTKEKRQPMMMSEPTDDDVRANRWWCQSQPMMMSEPIDFKLTLRSSPSKVANLAPRIEKSQKLNIIGFMCICDKHERKLVFLTFCALQRNRWCTYVASRGKYLFDQLCLTPNQEISK